MGKDHRLHFRLDSDAREKLRRVCELTGLDEATALRACIVALIEYVEKNGEITLPLRIVPRAEKKPESSERTALTASRAPRLEGDLQTPSLSEREAGYHVPKKPKQPKP